MHPRQRLEAAYRIRHGSATAALLAALAGCLLAAPAAMAAPPAPLQLADIVTNDTPPPPATADKPKPAPNAGAAPSSDPCAGQIAENDGIITIDLDNAGVSYQRVVIEVDGIAYSADYDGSGHLHAEAPLFHASAAVKFPGTGGAACTRKVSFTDYDTAFLMAIVWEGSNDLALHVTEPPDGRIGAPRHYVSPTHPNHDLRTGFGELHEFGAAVAGTKRVQLYSLPAERNPFDGEVQFFVEFASRGNPARAPFCGSDAHATVSYEAIQSVYGKVTHFRGQFAAVDCGTIWQGPQWEHNYLQSSKAKLTQPNPAGTNAAGGGSPQ